MVLDGINIQKQNFWEAFVVTLVKGSFAFLSPETDNEAE